MSIFFKHKEKKGRFLAILLFFIASASLVAKVTDKLVEPLLGISVAFQEQLNVQGFVTDSNGQPLPGVSVTVSGKSVGTQTDFNGYYTINVVKGDVLIFSYIGMRSQSIVVEKTSLNVSLQEEASVLEGVVVVGFGQQKKANVTGATATVEMDNILDNRPVSNALQAMQGTLPGLQITANSGQPGDSGLGINIRGMTSINGGNPLVLMDNVPIDISDVNPQDIKSVTVLKDASATAIYGARAAFGVIIITSKNPDKIMERPIKFNYNSTFSISFPEELPEKATTYEFVKALKDWGTTGFWTGQDVGKWFDFLEEYKTNPSKYPKGYAEDSGLRYPLKDTDVIGAWMKQGFTQIHNFSFSGGTNKSNYRVSIGASDQDGIIITRNDSYRKYNINASLNTALTSKLKSYTNIFYRKSDQRSPVGNYGSAIAFGPYIAAEGTHTLSDGRQVPYDSPASVERIKVAPQRLRDNIRMFQRLNWSIVENLELAGEYTFEKKDYSRITSDNQANVVRATRLTEVQGNVANTYYRRENNNTEYNAFNVYAKYKKDLGRNHLGVLIGTNAETNSSVTTDVKRNELINTNLPSLSGATGLQTTDDSFGEWSVLGYFTRINYNFDEKYFLEISSRYDGSSRFARGNRFGFFPSFSLGWHLGKEAFMQNISFLSSLKLRSSWGETGNQVTRGLYPSVPGMAITNYNEWGRSWLNESAGTRYSTLELPNLVSSSFSWEKVQTLNFGLDASFFDNRLSTSFDYFNRKTLNMLAAGSRLPATLGAAAPLQNAADLESNGWELDIRWNDRIGDFSYSIGFNIFDNQAKITKFHNPSGLLSQYYVGRAIGEIWGYTTDGFYTEDDFEAGTLSSNLTGGTLKDGIPRWEGVSPNPGDIKYIDYNGDGLINDGDNTLGKPGDRKVIGNNTRRYQYGIVGNARYKNFDLSFQIQGVGKRDVWLDNRLRFPYRDQFSIVYKSQLDYWTPDNRNAFFPRNYALGGGNYRYSRASQTRYLIDGSYLRIRNITIGYNIPKTILNKFKVDSLRVYVAVENLYNFNNYPNGINTELINKGGGASYPLMRSFSSGLNLTF